MLSNAASDKEQTKEIPMAMTTKNINNSTLMAVGSATKLSVTTPPAAKAE